MFAAKALHYVGKAEAAQPSLDFLAKHWNVVDNQLVIDLTNTVLEFDEDSGFPFTIGNNPQHLAVTHSLSPNHRVLVPVKESVRAAFHYSGTIKIFRLRSGVLGGPAGAAAA